MTYFKGLRDVSFETEFTLDNNFILFHHIAHCWNFVHFIQETKTAGVNREGAFLSTVCDNSNPQHILCALKTKDYFKSPT